ncbi:ABC transporter permease [bacterium]|nr:ABC transporter permease [bacterium]
MNRESLARLGSFLLLCLVVFVGSRALIRFLPGNPIDTIIAETGTSLSADALEKELGLDRPFLTATLEDAGNALRGDLGTSIHTKLPITPVLLERVKNSAILTLTALFFGALFSLTIGLLAARVPNGFWHRFSSVYGALLSALPTSWIGPMILWVLGVKLGWFPVSHHLALPAFTLALAMTGIWSRLIRERVRDTLFLEAAQAARARGLSEFRILLKYGLAPVSGALLAYLGTQIGTLLGGAFITEVIFDWPGMGALLVDSILKRDYPLIEASVFAAAVFSLFGSWLGDWIQSRVDPRLRIDGGRI